MPAIPAIASVPQEWCRRHRITPSAVKALSGKVVVVFYTPPKEIALAFALFYVREAGIVIYREWKALPRRIKQLCKKACVDHLLACP